MSPNWTVIDPNWIGILGSAIIKLLMDPCRTCSPENCPKLRIHSANTFAVMMNHVILALSVKQQMKQSFTGGLHTSTPIR